MFDNDKEVIERQEILQYINLDDELDKKEIIKKKTTTKQKGEKKTIRN